MTKDQILQQTGLSEQEFYNQYPTEESYFKRGGAKMQMGGSQQEQQEQLMAIIEAYAEANQLDPEELMQELQQADPQTQQEMLSEIMQSMQGQQEQLPQVGHGVTGAPQDHLFQTDQGEQYQMPEENPYADQQMQKGGSFEKTYNGRVYIVNPATQTVIDKATGTDATNMAGLEFPSLYKSVKGYNTVSAGSEGLDIPGVALTGDVEYLKNYNSVNPDASDRELLTTIRRRNDVFQDSDYLDHAAKVDASKSIMNKKNQITDDYYKGVYSKQDGGPSEGGQANTYMNKTNNFVSWLKNRSEQANQENMMEQMHQMPDGSMMANSMMKYGGLRKAEDGLAAQLAKPVTNSEDCVDGFCAVPEMNERGRGRGRYIPYNDYDQGYGYDQGYQNYGYGYGAPNYNMYGNPFMGLMGGLFGLGSGIASLFQGAGRNNRGFGREKGLLNGANANEATSAYDPKNGKSVLYDTKADQSTPTTNNADINAINRQNRQFGRKQDREYQKRLRKREQNNGPVTDFVTNTPQKTNNAWNSKWTNEEEKKRLAEEDIFNKGPQFGNGPMAYGGHIKFQPGGGVDPNGIAYPYFDPYQDYGMPEDEYDYPMDPNAIGDPYVTDPYTGLKGPGSVMETGPLPKGITPTWKDPYGNSLFKEAQGPSKAPKRDSSTGWGFTNTGNPWAADEMINGIQSLTSFANQAQQAKKDQTARGKMNDITNSTADTSIINRGDWLGSSGLAFGALRPNQDIYAGPNAFAKKGGTWFNNNFYQTGGQGEMMPDNEYNEGDEMYMTDEEIQAFLAAGGTLDYMD